MGLGADVASVFTPLGPSIALRSTSTALWLSRKKLDSHRCYLIDTDADGKGRYPVTHDAHMLARYNAVSSKRERQSASNVLAVLSEKGLVEAAN